MPLHADRTRLPIEDELLAEAASSLGRASERLEKALAELARFDAEPPRDASPADRVKLRDEARQALWYVIVQREAMGLRNHDDLLRALAVPREIAARMGPIRK